MELNSLLLRNFKNHRNKEIQFKLGVNGIVGENGHGKSAIIEAIIFLFTGTLIETKEKTITVGESEGYVRGTFTHEGKTGSIERHLSSSKVILKYDGKVLNKSTEVKELWNNLLQIDESIFNNVIVAKQGEIADLFCGNDMVRERIFQKIFLVPNTDKLRNIIWEDYIKKCPPEYLIEDVSLLRASMTELVTKLNPLSLKIDDMISRTLNDVTVSSVITRVGFLKKCIQDMTARPSLEESLAIISDILSKNREHAVLLQTRIDSIDYQSLRETWSNALRNRTNIEDKARIQVKLEALKASNTVTPERISECRRACQAHEAVMVEYQKDLAILNNTIHTTETLINKMSHLKGHNTCPTCAQELKDVDQFINDQTQSLQLNKKKLLRKEDEIQARGINYEGNRFIINAYEFVMAEKAKLQSKLLEYEALNLPVDINVSELEKQLQDYQDWKDELADINNNVTRLSGEKQLVENKLQNLSIYEGSSTPDEELSLMQQVLETNQSRKEEINQMKLEEAKIKTELTMLDARINTSMVNQKSNDKRNIYIKKLQTVHDLFHVSQFPRKLIQSYSSDVEEYLMTNVQHFNMPYTPKIVEGFRIEMHDNLGRVIPKLSGGQDIMVGLCLRLALHTLFAQSFPMWIVDEGTTHLDENNKTLYFNMLRKIKSDCVIKQVIIIDHDNHLIDVVDNIIKV